MHPTTWKASGHVDAFNDPLIDNKTSKKGIVLMFWSKIMLLKLKLKLKRKFKKQPSVLVSSFDEAQFRETNPREYLPIKKKQKLF